MLSAPEYSLIPSNHRTHQNFSKYAVVQVEINFSALLGADCGYNVNIDIYLVRYLPKKDLLAIVAYPVS